MKNKLFNEKYGFIAIFDIFLSVFLISIAILAFNFISTIEIPSLSESNYYSKNNQDILEIMSSAINGNEYSTLDSIVYALKSGNNSKTSLKHASDISKDFFKIYCPNQNYCFMETDVLNSTILSKSGNFDKAENLSVSRIHYGNYSFSLFLW